MVASWAGSLTARRPGFVSRSPAAPPEREGEGERPVLEAVHAAKLEASERGRLLNPASGPGELAGRGGAHGEIAGEAVPGVALGQLPLSPGHRLLLAVATVP